MPSQKLIVVDDESSVVEVVGLYLRSVGFDVATFASAEEVLSLTDGELREYDLLLTDYDMPGMNGDELADRIRILHPGINVILMSGSMGPDAACVLKFGPVLQKPFSLHKLRKLLESQEFDLAKPHSPITVD